MDGREMARLIREKLPSARIVVMTSVYKSPQHKYEALHNFGADDYLIKPIRSKVLADVLQRFLR
jgi:DNA-binding response OmpR family regulator